MSFFQIEFVAALPLFVGLAILGFSLIPIRQIYNQAGEYSRAWFVLLCIVSGLMIGYFVIAIYVLQNTASTSTYLTTLILLGVSLFVFLSAKLTQLSIREANRLTALERHRAQRDDLTGLPNRAFFTTQITSELQRSTPANNFAVIMVDLDGFESINETFGLYYGDILLQEVAMRLRRAIDWPCTLARLGGDEFGLLLTETKNLRDVVNLSQQLVAKLEQPFAVEGFPADLDVSIGIAVYPDHGEESDVLMSHAEIAMYEAKKTPAHIMFYDDVGDRTDLDHLTLLGELRQALENDQLDVHYQPQLNLSTETISGAEALVRWAHPRLGHMLPEEFIPLTEQSGLINKINQWVLEIVLDQLVKWQKQGITIPISVNVSAKNLQDSAFFDYLVEAIGKRSLSADQLILEITEGSVMSDQEQALDAIKRLSNFGIRFSIDDFGTGYSSLLYLKRLPVHEIKIDKSFVMDLAKDYNDTVIIRSTIELAHQIGHQVTAEGVESREVLDLLRMLGCDKVQGYHIGKPMDADEFSAWLFSNTNMTADSDLHPI